MFVLTDVDDIEGGDEADLTGIATEDNTYPPEHYLDQEDDIDKAEDGNKELWRKYHSPSRYDRGIHKEYTTSCNGEDKPFLLRKTGLVWTAICNPFDSLLCGLLTTTMSSQILMDIRDHQKPGIFKGA